MNRGRGGHTMPAPNGRLAPCWRYISLIVLVLLPASLAHDAGDVHSHSHGHRTLSAVKKSTPNARSTAAKIKAALAAKAHAQRRAATRRTRRGCGTIDPSLEQQIAAERDLAGARTQLAGQRVTVPIAVGIRFTIFTTTATPALGTSNVPDVIVKQQVADMNKFYGRYGFRFNLLKIQRVVSSPCANLDVKAASEDNADVTKTVEYFCKSRYKPKPYSPGILDVYTRQAVDGILGFATFPWDYYASTDIGGGPIFDGIFLDYRTMRGASTEEDFSSYNLGLTLVHETGHWLALYHPFQGACTIPGDWVSDTAPQAEPDYTCDSTAVSCGGPKYKLLWNGKLGYKNNVNTAMNYGYDSCLTLFTPHQANRMLWAWSGYRGSIKTDAPGSTTPVCKAGVMTFDNIAAPADGRILPVAKGYSRLAWGNFGIVNAAAAAAARVKLVKSGGAANTESGLAAYATGYTFGVVKANVLTNVGGKDAAIGLAVGVASFDLHSFYATPVLVDTLRLTLKGVTVKGVGIAAGFDIVNPQRTLVTLDAKWRNLKSVTFNAVRPNYPGDPVANHVFAIDNMCLIIPGPAARSPPPPRPPPPVKARKPPPPRPPPPRPPPPRPPPPRPPPPTPPSPAIGTLIQANAFPHGTATTADTSLFPIGADDLNSDPIYLSQPFYFLDTEFTSYTVNSNGYLQSGLSGGTLGTPSALPYIAVSNAFFPYWQDWDTRGVGSTPNGAIFSRVQTDGTSADHVQARGLLNTFFSRSTSDALTCVSITTWVAMGLYDKDYASPASFQLMLATSGSSSYVCFIYGTIPPATFVASAGKYSRSGYQAKLADGTYKNLRAPGVWRVVVQP